MSQAEAKVQTQVVAEVPVVQNEETQSFQQQYQSFKGQIRECWNWSQQTRKEWDGWDDRWARSITDFKKDYILSIGDLMNRSICMAIAGGLTYKLINFGKPSLIRRTRNLGASFLLSGWLFVPELFNPFLPKID